MISMRAPQHTQPVLDGSSSNIMRVRARRRVAMRCVAEGFPAPRVPDARLQRPIPLPPLASCYHFVNLTNGLEAIPHLSALGLPYQFTRIQSTYCEQNRFEDLIIEADSGLLMGMATGHTCLVWDFGSRNIKRGVPRAVWYGLEFLRYATQRAWLRGSETADDNVAYLRGYNVANDFDEKLQRLGKTAKNKLRYYGKFVPPHMRRVALYGVYDDTAHDSDKHVYQSISAAYLPPDSEAPLDVPPQLQRYIAPRVLPTMNPDDLVMGDPVRALWSLGFSAFLGGVCHSVVDDQAPFYRP
eukprot:jgi/Ulvmu1/6637/UM003_0275.1